MLRRANLEKATKQMVSQYIKVASTGKHQATMSWLLLLALLTRTSIATSEYANLNREAIR